METQTVYFYNWELHSQNQVEKNIGKGGWTSPHFCQLDADFSSLLIFRNTHFLFLKVTMKIISSQNQNDNYGLWYGTQLMVLEAVSL